jgi:hypothetical protein
LPYEPSLNDSTGNILENTGILDQLSILLEKSGINEVVALNSAPNTVVLASCEGEDAQKERSEPGKSDGKLIVFSTSQILGVDKQTRCSHLPSGPGLSALQLFSLIVTGKSAVIRENKIASLQEDCKAKRG